MLIRTASFPGPNHGAIVTAKPKHPGEALLEEIEAFARQHRLTASGVCRKATGNGNLLEKLQCGTSPRPVTIERLRRYMREYSE